MSALCLLPSTQGLQRTALVFAMAMLSALVPCSALAQSNPSAVTDEVSYSNDIRPIVNNFCTTCHAGRNPQGEFVLTSYQDVRKHTEQGQLLERINDAENPMPENGLMPQYMRRLFRVWAEQGYIEQGSAKRVGERRQMLEYTPPKIEPVNINRQGFELLEYMQGHWVGSMTLMGTKYDWMAFDFRPIAASHIHGLFEGGTIGNLFTSFFVTEFRGQRTIMARNGGMLNGIYRTSYFVLDQVRYGRDWGYYRLVDAYGGADIMYMELTFRGDTLQFSAHTSRFGLTAPKPHMLFEGRRKHPGLASQAAEVFGFPKNVIGIDFSKGLPESAWAEEFPQTSATYIWEANDKNLIELGKLAKDPVRIDQMPYLSQLAIQIQRSPSTQGKKLQVYLSRDSLVDRSGKFITQYGYIREDLLDTLLLFPELGAQETEFNFTYLHPGEYYLTVIADMDADGFPSPGDITHPQQKVTIRPKSKQRLTIRNLNVQN